MGHTRLSFEDIDVNSFQSLYGLARRRVAGKGGWNGFNIGKRVVEVLHGL